MDREDDESFIEMIENLKKVSAILMMDGMKPGGNPNKIVLGNAIAIACSVYSMEDLQAVTMMMEGLIPF